jgi:Tfp pilus assembly protein PilO
MLSAKVEDLSSYQELISGKRRSSETKRDDLSSLKNQYSDQTEVLANTKEEQAKLLEVTKSEEQNYQQLLASKQETKDQIIREMRDFESKLQFILDPSTIPTAGTAAASKHHRHAIFRWYRVCCA